MTLRPFVTLVAAAGVLAAVLVGGAPSGSSAGDPVTGDPAGSAAINGDVTCDGSVDSVDALQVLRSAAGMSTSAECLDVAADVDCDSDRDSVDALRVLRHVAGLPPQTPPGCTPIGEPLATSDELIEAALADGKISDEEATIYHVYAAFGDSRLPDEYRGAPSDLPDSDAAMMAAMKFNSLSPSAQEKLRPFLTPPNAPGSWTELPTPGP